MLIEEILTGLVFIDGLISIFCVLRIIVFNKEETIDRAALFTLVLLNLCSFSLMCASIADHLLG